MRERSPLVGVAAGNVPSDEVPLSEFTTLRLGGRAERLIVAATEAELVDAVTAVGSAPLLLLAGGSNVVVADEGFPGAAVLVRNRGMAQRRPSVGDRDRVILTVAAGEPWDEVCAYAVASGFSGVEALSGIPGSAGATPIQNVGAYGHEVAETIIAVRALDRGTGEVRTLSPEECSFGYRTSVFKRSARYVLLSVDFSLPVSPLSAPVRYAELARVLGVRPGERAPLAEVRDAVLGLRAGKGMVLDSEDQDTWSVGSFFTNPVLDSAAFEELVRRTTGAGSAAGPPAWPAPEGAVKTSAAWLIERAGFSRGYPGPGNVVAVSSKHTLALTHRGGGSTRALLGLAGEIRDGVADRFGLTLHPEPVLVNCSMYGARGEDFRGYNGYNADNPSSRTDR